MKRDGPRSASGESDRAPSAREAFPFTWYATCGMPVYAALAGVRHDRLFRDLDAIREAYTVGEPLAHERYGPDVRYSGPGWAGISYGHINCLGSELTFPPGSEVAHTPIHGSLQEGIAHLREQVDWSSAGLMPFYLDLWDQLKRAFPDCDIPFGGFGVEGPITTAWELRGHGFFLDLHDDPARCHEYLHLVTESIVSYAAFLRQLNGQPAFLNTRLGLYDDVSSLIHPEMWPTMVLPFQERFFAAQTSGQRHAHIENLTRSHLRHLDALRLDSFDPSVTFYIQPSDLRDRCSVPFLWRLNPMQVRDLTPTEIEGLVFASVADGASGVFCTIARTMVDPESTRKVRTFIDAAQRVGHMLAEGVPRAQLRAHARAGHVDAGL